MGSIETGFSIDRNLSAPIQCDLMARFAWLAFLSSPAILHALTYEVFFSGLDDPAVLRSLRDASQLVSLQDHPPASINGLRYRIHSDLPALIETLHAFSYYEAVIEPILHPEPAGSYQVLMRIVPGPQYTLSSYEVYSESSQCDALAKIRECPSFSPKRLGLLIGKPAHSFEIVNGELNILTLLSECGYPLASITKRRVEVDMKTKEVRAAACIDEGERALFGASTFFGLQSVKPLFVKEKIGWKEGEIYDSSLIEKTQERLLKSELFSSVYISHEETLNALGEMPMKIRVAEAKHQRVSLGGFWGTVDGPGFTFNWIHRNIGGMGDVLSAKGDVSRRFIAGKFAYKKNDFLTFGQTYRAFGELSRENINPYLSFIYRGAQYIDRNLDPETSFSAGMKLEHINVSKSAVSGTYLLLGVPLFFRYENIDDALDPTQGVALIYSATPYQSLFFSNQHFVKQRLTGNFYIPFGHRRFTLALRAQFGSIAGATQKNVPMPKLFLGASENDLRGFRYKTVSPLNASKQPYGGRSAILTTAEIRWRVTKTIGLVPFADFGTVSFSQWPNFTDTWYKSVGIGFRYFTFFGPLRLDAGFPLNRRSGVDHRYQIYASVGQTF